ncbi:flagellar export chaperone FliS [Desulfocapsa sp. AH-315-G09]|jgi:flagellar protein FliS|nr:flagellar export chaperone FliS [Desulfocapsa sp.]MBN4065090.1 flagellar export chaperone FliS [Desulfocapsa sp. AH-315-G09]
MNAYMQQYKQNSIETASPEQILILLYDGAIRFTRQAIAASEQKDQIAKLGRISKVFAIIVEFSNTLNHDIGGEIAADLDGLYQFMLRELSKARTETDEKSLHVVEGLLVDLRTTWGEAILKNKAEIKQQEESSQLGSNKTVAVAG